MKINNYFLPMITAICLFCSFGFLRAMELEERALLNACRTGDIEMVREYLDEGVDPNCSIEDRSDPEAVVPIFVAVTGNHLDVLKLLVKEGADIHYVLPCTGQKLHAGSNVLHLAAYLGRQEIITWLLDEQKMDINVKNDSECGCLEHAIFQKNIDLLKWLVDIRGAKIDSVCLLVACHYADLETVRWLVEEKGICLLDQCRDELMSENSNFRGSFIYMSLLNDISEKLDIFTYLLSRGSDVNYGFMDIFYYLTSTNELSIIKKFVDYGFDINREVSIDITKEANIFVPIENPIVVGSLINLLMRQEKSEFPQIFYTTLMRIREIRAYLETLRDNQKFLEKHINELVFLLEQFDTKGELDQELKATVLKEIKKLFDTDETPMYAKQTAIVDLYKLHYAYRNYHVNPIPLEDVVYCLKQILYNTRFFCKSDFALVREFAIKKRIKDIFNRSILEEAIVFCPSEIKNKIVSHILYNDADLYKNKKLFSAFLAESENEKGFCRRFVDMFVYTNIRDMYKDVSKNISRWRNKEKVYDMCKRQNDFMNALALAKEMKRKEDFRMLANFSFVTDALQNDEVVDVPGNSADYSHLPPEVGMHILGFAGVQSFTDKMIFGKKYSKKTVN